MCWQTHLNFFQVLLSTSCGRLLYTHGTHDDIFFDTDLPWLEICLTGFTGSESRILARFTENRIILGAKGTTNS